MLRLYIGAHHWLCVCHLPENKVVFILDSLPVSNDLSDETIFQIWQHLLPTVIHERNFNTTKVIYSTAV